MADALPQTKRLGARLPPGTVLADRYRVELILGAGAFGVVWRARHVHLETECAVKLFDPPLDADPQEARARFLQEARVMARLKCPHVAEVFDYGVHEGIPFLVLELLTGNSLEHQLQVLGKQGLRLSAAQTARVVRQVAEALHVAHAARVVHRDLKPANILLAQEGEGHSAKVLDFGIAKWSSEAAAGVTTTRTVMGTAYYMSPEQFESARDVDHRADLWSLGVIAFECLTGQVPFPGDSFIDVAFKVCREGPLVASQIAAVPAGFDAWFAHATARGLEHRFTSALEQAQALEQLCAHATVLTPAVRRSTHRSLSLRRAAAWLGAACLAALVAWQLPTLRRPAVAALSLGEKTLTVQPPSPASVPSSASPVAALLAPTSPGIRPIEDPAPPATPAVKSSTRPTMPEPRTGPPTPNAAPVRAPAPAAPAPVRAVAAPSAANAPARKAAEVPPARTVELAAEKTPAETVAPPLVPALATSQSTFDRYAAKTALDNAAAQAANCRPSGGPTGTGRVEVRYDPSGLVTAVSLLTSTFANTAAGSCVVMLFRRARVPAFSGVPMVVVRKAFEIPASAPAQQ